MESCAYAGRVGAKKVRRTITHALDLAYRHGESLPPAGFVDWLTCAGLGEASPFCRDSSRYNIHGAFEGTHCGLSAIVITVGQEAACNVENL